MVRKNSFRPNCEALETREVPAIMLAGTFGAADANGIRNVPTGGTVSVTEVSTMTNRTVFTPQGNFGGMRNFDSQTGDTLTFNLSGSTLTITNTTDVIIMVDQNGNFVNFSGTITVQGVTGLNVNLDQGGNDSVTDNTMGLPVTINGGTGNDAITAAGSPINPQLLPFLMANPQLASLFAQMSGPAKNISGGAGMDNITVSGFASMYMIDGGDDKDTIQGPRMGTFNQLKGGAGDDTIIGGFGQDIIFGDAGLDIIAGLGGNDFLITVDAGPDFVLNTPGDTVIGDPLDTLATPLGTPVQGQRRP